MKTILCAVALFAVAVNTTHASHIKILSKSYYVEGRGSYFDQYGKEVIQSYQVPGEQFAHGQISVGQQMSFCSNSMNFSVSVGPVTAYGSSDKGSCKAYAYASMAIIFQPLQNETHLSLLESVNVYPCFDEPVGAWAWLYDQTANTSIDSVMWRTHGEPELPGGWQGVYNLNLSHTYKMVMNVAADAADDGGWFARMEVVMAPEPATVLLLIFGACAATRRWCA